MGAVNHVTHEEEVPSLLKWNWNDGWVVEKLVQNDVNFISSEIQLEYME